ncbi:hypothetical protein ACIO6T_37895 [Streptomyces sp. NPDC087532]|uniref:hypothetical protein n=1 Tax=Streptomyces sp. NPDC087532 TaxID=3365795 RepID=UPI0037F5D452
MTVLMMRLLPIWVTDLAVDLAGHRRISRAIDRAFAAEDPQALTVFRTGALAATFTRRGHNARGEELAEYARLVMTTDLSFYRYHRTFAGIDPQD